MRLRWRMLGIKSNNTNIHDELKYIENRGIYIANILLSWTFIPTEHYYYYDLLLNLHTIFKQLKATKKHIKHVTPGASWLTMAAAPSGTTDLM